MTDLTKDPPVMIVFPNRGYFVPDPNSELMKQLMKFNFAEPKKDSSEKILEPVANMNEPVVKADSKLVKKDEPVVKMNEPAVKMNEPAVKKDEPVVKADAKPVNKKDEPVAKADSNPLNKKDESVVKMNEPVVKADSKPVNKKEEPVAKADSKPVNKKEEPVAKADSKTVKKFTDVIAAAPKVAPEVKVAPKKVVVQAAAPSGKCQLCHKNAPYQPHLKYCYHCFNSLPFCYVAGCQYRTDHQSGFCTFCYQDFMEDNSGYEDEEPAFQCIRCNLNWTDEESGVCSDCTKTCENKKKKCQNLTQGHKFCKSCWEGILKETRGMLFGFEICISYNFLLTLILFQVLNPSSLRMHSRLWIRFKRNRLVFFHLIT